MSSEEKKDSIFTVRKIGPHHRLMGSENELLAPANKFLLANETRGLSPKTVRSYAFDLSELLAWIIGKKYQFQDITHSDLYVFINEQKEKVRKTTTINRKLSTIQSFYRFLYGHDVPVGKGALRPVKKGSSRRQLYPKKLSSFLKIRESEKVIEPLSADDIESFLGRITRYRDLAIVFLMFMCGCRSSEVLGLQVGDINFLERQLKITGKGRKERIMPMPDILVTIFDRYFQMERPKEAKTRLVFVALQGKTKGQPLKTAGLRTIFRYHRGVSGITQANPHRFRHTFGAEMAKSNVRLATLQKMMGHSDPSTTLRYINLSIKDVCEEYERAIEKIQKKYESKI